MIKKSTMKRAFQGLSEYTETIKEFKYKHVYESMRTIVKSWRAYSEICIIKRQELALIKKKRELLVLNNALIVWKNHISTIINNNHIKDTIQMRLKVALLNNCFKTWKKRYNKKINSRERKKRALVQCDTAYKLKAMKGVMVYLNRKYLKKEKYHNCLQMYYRELLRGILKKWTLMRIKVNKLRDDYMKLSQGQSKKLHFELWKSIFFTKKRAEYSYEQSLKRHMIQILKENASSANRKKLAVRKLEYEIKRKVIAGFRKVKNRRCFTVGAVAQVGVLKLRKIVSALKTWVERRRKQRMNAVSSIEFYMKSYKRKVIKALRIEKIKTRLIKNCLQVFFNYKIRNALLEFRQQAKINKKWCEIAASISAKHNRNSKLLVLNNWRDSLKDYKSMIKIASNRYSFIKKKRVMSAWKSRVNKTQLIKQMNTNAISKYKLYIMKLTVQGMKKYMRNPVMAKDKKAIRFYLTRIYRKYIRKLSNSVNQRKFYESSDKYCKLKLKRNMLRKWLKVCIKKTAQKNFFKGLLRKLAKKALFGLLINMEQQKHDRVLLIEAERFRVHTLTELSFNVLKANLIRKYHVESKVEKMEEARSMEQVRTALKQWSVIANTKKLIAMSTAMYETSINIIRLRGSLRLMRMNYYTTKAIREMREKSCRTVSKIVLNELKSYSEYRKRMKMMTSKSCCLHKRVIMKALTKYIKQHMADKNARKKQKETALHAAGRKLKMKSMLALNKFTNRNKIDRSKMHLIASNHAQSIVKAILKLMQEKCILRIQRIKFLVGMKRVAFKKLRDKIIERKIAREVAQTQLDSSLSHYADTLMKKSLLVLRQRIAIEHLKQNYSKVMKKYIRKQYFELWKRAFLEFSISGLQKKTNKRFY